VYLPAGCDWYNYWTNERVHGGQSIVADAPIDMLPLFVRAGSIVPLGSDVDSAQEKQRIGSVRVYPGANGSFPLFEDDGKTYAYEKGGGSITTLTWDEAAHRLTHDGGAASSELDKATVVVIGK
jgi:alpha-glucosidase/alpha-D-xyloside xylohydrolase